MLNHVFSDRPELYKHTHCAYEAPPVSAEIIKTLDKKLETKINVWYSDNGNLADDYKILLRDLKKLKTEKTMSEA